MTSSGAPRGRQDDWRIGLIRAIFARLSHRMAAHGDRQQRFDRDARH
jgi:hypothetical protein